jgi:hypothetical protein
MKIITTVDTEKHCKKLLRPSVTSVVKEVGYARQSSKNRNIQ